MLTFSAGLLTVSCLPSLETLQLWQNQGVGHLINVSGVDLFDIYPNVAFKDFHILQFVFADIFTSAPILEYDIDYQALSSDQYLQVSSEEHRQAFLGAVQTLVFQLHNKLPTSVFCHRGLGRSPLVTAAAFGQVFNDSLMQAIARTRMLHPTAQFTSVSASALYWCREQLVV